MYKILKAFIVVVWCLDIFNVDPNIFPFLQPYLGYVLNDANHLNTLFWIVLFLILPTSSSVVRRTKDE